MKTKELTKEEKLNFILKSSHDYNITAYEIGKSTELNVSGIDRILKKETKTPNPSTINIIYNYIVNKLSNTNNILEEPSEIYNSADCLEKVTSLEKELNYKNEIIDLLKEQIKLIKNSNHE